MKAYLIMLNAALILLSGSLLSAQSNDNFSEFIHRAIKASPKIKMLEARADAAGNKVIQETNLPDPKMSIGLVNLPVNSFSFTQEPMTGKMISISQAVPFPGRLSAAEDFYSIDIVLIENELAEEQMVIKRDVMTKILEYHYTEKIIEIINDKKLLLTSLAEVVRTKYSVSQASQQNILNIELAITNLEDRLEEQYSRSEIILRTMQTIMNTDTTPDFGIYNFTPIQETDLDYDNLFEMADNYRPALKNLKLLKKKSAISEKLANFEFYPDFNLTLQYSQRDKISPANTNLNDFISVIIGFNLPINYGGKKDAGIETAKSYQDYYSNQVDNFLRMLKIEAEESINKMESLVKREKIISGKKLIQASENFSSSLSGYQVGEIEFINVIDAVDKLLEIESELYKLRKEYLLEKVKLSYLAGNEV